MIGGVGLPYAYGEFTKKDAPGAPPYICFLYPSRGDFAADDANYAHITALVIELYTDAVDFALEAAVEAALAANGLPYAVAREFIESEKMHQTTYTTEVLLEDARTDE